MTGIDVEHTAADSIRSWAEDFYILGWVVGNDALVLFVMCITVEGNTDDSLFDIVGKSTDGVEDDGCSLTKNTLLDSIDFSW